MLHPGLPGFVHLHLALMTRDITPSFTFPGPVFLNISFRIYNPLVQIATIGRASGEMQNIQLILFRLGATSCDARAKLKALSTGRLGHATSKRRARTVSGRGFLVPLLRVLY